MTKSSYLIFPISEWIENRNQSSDRGSKLSLKEAHDSEMGLAHLNLLIKVVLIENSLMEKEGFQVTASRIGPYLLVETRGCQSLTIEDLFHKNGSDFVAKIIPH